MKASRDILVERRRRSGVLARRRRLVLEEEDVGNLKLEGKEKRVERRK